MLPHLSCGIAIACALFASGQAQAHYALAYGSNGKRWAYGTSHDAPSAEAARKQALELCGLKGCQVVMSGRGLCAAIAVAGQNGTAAWTDAPNLAEAREGALVGCSESGRRCTIKASFCDTASSTPADPATAIRAPASTDGNASAALKAQLRTCLSLAGEGFGAEDTARITLGLDATGALAFSPLILAVGNGRQAGAFATRAIIALNRCAPFGTLSAASLLSLQNTTIEFSPEDFR